MSSNTQVCSRGGASLGNSLIPAHGRRSRADRSVPTRAVAGEMQMKVRDQEILIPTSMVGNYPNPRWWDSDYARFFTGDQQPPDAMQREALEDAVGAIARDQEIAGLDIISDGRPHGDNYADTAV